MSYKTSTATETTLGMMDGLRSYAPDRGWEDLKPDQETSSEKNVSDDDFFEDDYEPIADKVSDGTKTEADMEEDFLDQELSDVSENSNINVLARKVAKTNLLVDSALKNDDKVEAKSEASAVKQLDQLGSNLSDLFSELYNETSENLKSPWENVSEAFEELSSEVKKREELRKQLTETQKNIDLCRKELINTIERLAHDEQERLAIVRMRSRLATVMADKLLKKLK